jgi:hypothetical protein
MIFEIDVSNVYKRKSECRDIEYLVSYVRKDNRYYMHPLVHKEFYRKKDMIQHIKKAYKNKKVLSDLRIKFSLPELVIEV